jgi:hypothetical protein
VFIRVDAAFAAGGAGFAASRGFGTAKQIRFDFPDLGYKF